MRRLAAPTARWFARTPRFLQSAMLAYLSVVNWLIGLLETRPIMGTAGFISLGPVLAIAALVLGVVVTVMLLAALAPIYFPAVKNLTVAFTAADTGSTLANTILGIIAILIPLVLTFGFAFLVFRIAGKMKGGKSGGY